MSSKFTPIPTPKFHTFFIMHDEAEGISTPLQSLVFWDTDNTTHVEQMARLFSFEVYTVTHNDDDSTTLQKGIHYANRGGYCLIDTSQLGYRESEPFLEVDTRDDDERDAANEGDY